MLFSSICALAALVASTCAVRIPVTVGGPNGLVFTPSSVRANQGDVVVFTFGVKNHTVTQSSLENPCTPLSGGFDTGFQPVAPTDTNPIVAEFTVMDSNPVWAFCRQAPAGAPSHCQNGMVFAINSPDDKFQQFVQTAKSGQQAPPSPPSTTVVSTSTSATTSTSSTSASSASTASTPSSTAGSPTPGQTHTVTVGQTPFAFSPNNIQAAVGDIVLFQFYPKNHTVTQSTFGTPCTPGSVPGSLTPGFDSGFMPIAAGGIAPQYSFVVNDTKPIWAFCAQPGHCGMGMVFAVNAPSDGNTFTAFQQKAMTFASASASGSSPSSTSAANTVVVQGAAVGIIGTLLALLI